MGGPQTQPFVLYPAHLSVPVEPLIGAAAVNELLREWRDAVTGRAAGVATPGRPVAPQVTAAG